MQQPSQSNHHNVETPRWVVVIGANTGGPQALAKSCPGFPRTSRDHIRSPADEAWVFARSHQHSRAGLRLAVIEPVDGQALSSSRILVAPSGCVLTLNCIDTSAGKGYNILVEETADTREQGTARADTPCPASPPSTDRKPSASCSRGWEPTAERACARSRGPAASPSRRTDLPAWCTTWPLRRIDAGVVQEVLPL